MTADTLERHRDELDRIVATLDRIVAYLASDLETARLEGARLDANTREVGELGRRLTELELRGSNHLRYLDSLQSSLDRIAATSVAIGAGDHSKHVDRLADRGYVVVNLESSPPELLGSFVRVDEEVAFYLDEEATPRRAPLDCIAIVPPVEAAAIVAGRRPK